MCRSIQIPVRGSHAFRWFLILYALGFLSVLFEIFRVYSLSDRFGNFDFPFIYNFAYSFISSNFLYSTDPTLYKPSVPTGYPHPPLSPSILISAIKLGLSREEIFNLLAFFHVVCFFGAIFCCWFGARAKRSWISFFAVLFSAVFMAPLMEHNLTMLLLEPCLLFLVCLSLLFMAMEKEFLAGILVGLGAMLKIYPAVFVIYFLVTRRWRSLAGACLSVVVCLLFSVIVMGLKENITYFTVALPQQLKELPYLFFYENTSLPSYMLYFDIVSPAVAKKIGTAIFLILLLLSIYPSFKSLSLVRGKNMVVALDYACLTSLLVLCMPNSWWNYQIHLVVSAVVVAIFLAKQNRPEYLLSFLLAYALISLAITTAMAVDTDIQYFVDMENSVRLVYIVLRGVPNLILFGLPFVIRWQVFRGGYCRL